MPDLSLTYVWDMPKMYSGNSFHSNNVQEKNLPTEFIENQKYLIQTR